MGRFRVVLVVLAALPWSLFSDTRIVTREHVGGRNVVSVRYERGNDSQLGIAVDSVRILMFPFNPRSVGRASAPRGARAPLFKVARALRHS